MQPQRLGPRAGMGPFCLGCSHRKCYSPIRTTSTLKSAFYTGSMTKY
uniref:Apolipoprotein B mRNA editing enzyme, catalytic polypeptide 3 n=1 Tax=Mus musculus TaxID=10090 RepID=H3BKS5_MOUSE